MRRGGGNPLLRVDRCRTDPTTPAQHCTPERSRADYENAQGFAFDIRAELLEAFDTVDAIITPTCSLPAIRVGEEQREIGGVMVSPNRYLGGYTSVFGLAGLPAVSVPCGFTSGGLPIGMQLVGAHFEETRILQLARLVEHVTELV